MTAFAIPAKTQTKLGEMADLRLARHAGRQWQDLPASVQSRFLKYIGPKACAVYTGEVRACRRNLAGSVLAHLLQLIGAPLPLDHTSKDQPAAVTITRDAKTGGQIWSRQYNRRRGVPQIIHSVKAFAGPTGLEERIGAGFAMSLRLEVAGGALLFKSAGYRWRFLGLDLALPTWLAPGDLTVGHHPLDDTRFEFTLDLIHPWFGELLHQRILFHDTQEA